MWLTAALTFSARSGFAQGAPVGPNSPAKDWHVTGGEHSGGEGCRRRAVVGRERPIAGAGGSPAQAAAVAIRARPPLPSFGIVAAGRVVAETTGGVKGGLLGLRDRRLGRRCPAPPRESTSHLDTSSPCHLVD
jgi:hypothetical protein